MSTEPRWQLQLSGDPDTWDRLLAQGWEPFAAFLSVGRIIAFRRLEPATAFPSVDELQHRGEHAVLVLYSAAVQPRGATRAMNDAREHALAALAALAERAERAS